MSWQCHLSRQGSVSKCFASETSHYQWSGQLRTRGQGTWGPLTLHLLCDLKLWMAQLLGRRRKIVPITPLPTINPHLPPPHQLPLPEIADELLSEKGRCRVPWFLRDVSIVCVIHVSTSHTFPLNVLAPSHSLIFHVLLTVLRLMRPNSQAMSVWIKGTWESLFMPDPGKFPVSCL